MKLFRIYRCFFAFGVEKHQLLPGKMNVTLNCDTFHMLFWY